MKVNYEGKPKIKEVKGRCKLKGMNLNLPMSLV